jgi:hypothetical protein
MTDKVKRTMLSPEQRVAKLEAELAAAKAKAEARTNKEAQALLDRRLVLANQIEERQLKINVINDKLVELGFDPLSSEPDEDVTISTDVDQFV